MTVELPVQLVISILLANVGFLVSLLVYALVKVGALTTTVAVLEERIDHIEDDVKHAKSAANAAKSYLMNGHG